MRLKEEVGAFKKDVDRLQQLATLMTKASNVHKVRQSL